MVRVTNQHTIWQIEELTDNLVVGIVIHTANSLNTDMALHLVTALAKQKEVSKQETYMIHVREAFFLTCPAADRDTDLRGKRIHRNHWLAAWRNQRHRPIV